MQEPIEKSPFTTIPNMLTIGRMFMIPVIVVLFYMPFQWSYMASAIIFALAGITDFVDGYLARRWGQSTPLGAFLDPVADKLMVSVVLIMLVAAYSQDTNYGPLLAIPSMVIIGREVTVSALREWMAEMGKRASVAVSLVGKVKTTAQMVAITGLLAVKPDMDNLWVQLSFVLIFSAMILTLWSMFMYLRAAWPELTR
jgi:CDP-diacylglycerol--glycerol-3-phosphate 3-phosphatidyltransferase